MNLKDVEGSNIYNEFNKLIYDKLLVISNSRFNKDFEKCEIADQESVLSIFIEENK